MTDIAAWLEQLGLAKYAPIFSENEVEPADLSELSEGRFEGDRPAPRSVCWPTSATREPTRTRPSGRCRRSWPFVMRLAG